MTMEEEIKQTEEHIPQYLCYVEENGIKTPILSKKGESIQSFQARIKEKYPPGMYTIMVIV